MPSLIGCRRRTPDRPSRARSWQPYWLAGLFGIGLVVGGALWLWPDGAGPAAATQPPAGGQQPARPIYPGQPPAGVFGGQPAPGQQPPGPRGTKPAPAQAPPAATAPQSPLDEPLRLIAEARQMYQRVQTYTCMLISQERVRGQLKPENVIALTFRTQPFSVYMKWLGPKDLVGQEVAYIHGRNENKMRVHPVKGIGAMFVGNKFISIDTRDPRVLEHSNHTITETGIGNLIEQLANAWAFDRQTGKARVQVAEYDYAQRRCIRVEVARTERHPQMPYYRTAAYFDKQTRLPVRVENYGWPQQGGAPQGDLLECFSYVNLQFNMAVNDALFNR